MPKWVFLSDPLVRLSNHERLCVHVDALKIPRLSLPSSVKANAH